jgi:hypothetical protein
MQINISEKSKESFKCAQDKFGINFQYNSMYSRII